MGLKIFFELYSNQINNTKVFVNNSNTKEDDFWITIEITIQWFVLFVQIWAQNSYWIQCFSFSSKKYLNFNIKKFSNELNYRQNIQFV